MSHNISYRTRRANIPAGCLDDLLDWRFLITCPRCREQRIITVTVMAAQAGRSEVNRPGRGPFTVFNLRMRRAAVRRGNQQPAARGRLKGPGAFS